MNRLGKILVVLLTAAGLSGLAVQARAADQAKPDLNRGEAIAAQVCASCHGAVGNSAGGAYPKLAGQHPEYLTKQLNDFKIQPGAKQPARNNPIMAGIAAALSDQDAVNVSAYFATQAPKPGYAHNKNTVPLRGKRFTAPALRKKVCRRVQAVMGRRGREFRRSIRGCRGSGRITRQHS